jgi:pimeloyl-ACP methyl ester carboxylesterase
LEDQITSRLQLLEDQLIPAGPRQGEEYDGIILIGHSVGTYMLLELLQRLRKSGSSLKVKGGVLLMPTVMGLAESPSGVMSSPIFRIGGFPWAFSRAAKGLIWLTPRSALKWVVSSVLGMPENGAETTTRFLTSSMGVWQAL